MKKLTRTLKREKLKYFHGYLSEENICNFSAVAACLDRSHFLNFVDVIIWHHILIISPFLQLFLIFTMTHYCFLASFDVFLKSFYDLVSSSFFRSNEQTTFLFCTCTITLNYFDKHSGNIGPYQLFVTKSGDPNTDIRIS